MARPKNPFRYFDSSPEMILLIELMEVKFPLSLRSLDDPALEPGVSIYDEKVQFWYNSFRRHSQGKQLEAHSAPFEGLGLGRKSLQDQWSHLYRKTV
jgi:hypothetical protein